MFDETTAWMSWVLANAGYDETANVVSRIGAAATADAATLNQLYERVTLEAIGATVDGLRTHGTLSDDNVNEIRALWLEIQSRVEAVASASTVDLSASALAGLHLCGVISLTSQGNASFFLHPDLSAANLSRLARFDAKAAKRHIRQIASVRGEDFGEEVDDLYDFHVIEMRERIQESLVSMTRSWTRPLRDVQVDMLPTSADFYWAGTQHYRTRRGKSCPFTIFSTTPGLFLPEDRYGPSFFRDVLGREDLAVQIAENSERAPYFTALTSGARKRPRIYYFELARAAQQYERSVAALTEAEKARYDECALQLLNPMLQQSNFGLIRISQFPQEFNHLTLGNGRSVVVSTRHSGKIGHGLWVRPQSSSHLRESMRAADLKSALEAALAAGSAGVLAGAASSLVEDLEKTALAVLYAPLVYALMKGESWRPNAVKNSFEDFSARLRIQSTQVETVVIKHLGAPGPVRPIGSIRDLLRTDF
ncbi:hypothetical protein ACWGI9_42090 [Streptomyces sp. NPDC054833]